jgi:hypothetical protein
LVLLIKIYSTDISTQKDANTLSICLIGFTYSPIHQSRHNFVFFRNYCTGGHSRKLVSRAMYVGYFDLIHHLATRGRKHKMCLKKDTSCIADQGDVFFYFIKKYPTSLSFRVYMVYFVNASAKRIL